MVKPYKGAGEQSENFKGETHSPPSGDSQLYPVFGLDNF